MLCRDDQLGVQQHSATINSWLARIYLSTSCQLNKCAYFKDGLNAIIG